MQKTKSRTRFIRGKKLFSYQEECRVLRQLKPLKPEMGQRLWERKDLLLFLTMLKVGAPQWIYELANSKQRQRMQCLMRLWHSLPECQNCKWFKKSLWKVYTWAGILEPLHRTGQIQLLTSYDSPGWDWLSDSAAPGPLPYAPRTGGWGEGGQEKAWTGEAVPLLLTLGKASWLQVTQQSWGRNPNSEMLSEALWVDRQIQQVVPDGG